MDFVIENGVLVSYKGTKKNIVIPEKVTVIGPEAFRESPVLYTVTVPGTVREISDRAFQGCAHLSKVSLIEGLKEIKTSAFEGCGKLKKIRIPAGVTKIYQKAFCGCVSLEEADLNPGLLEIGTSAFEGCESLKSMNIPSSVTVIQDAAFRGCEKMRSIWLPMEIETIRKYTFADSGILAVSFPKSVKVIESMAFSGCCKLEYVCFFNADTILEPPIFPGLTCQKKIDVCNAEFTFHGECFKKYDKTAKWLYVYSSTNRGNAIAFANAVSRGEKIPEEVFRSYLMYIRRQRKRLYQSTAGCRALLDLMLEENVVPAEDIDRLTEIWKDDVEVKARLLEYDRKHSGAAYREKQMRKALDRAFSGGKPTAAELRKIWNYETEKDGTVTITKYKGTEETAEIPQEIARKPVCAIAPEAFSRNETLKNVLIPESVEKIGEPQFLGCEAFWREQKTFAFKGVFYGCAEECVELVIPEGITRIARCAFHHRWFLKNIQFPHSLESIAEEAFQSCYSLTEIHLPEKLRIVTGFNDCEDLQEVTISDGTSEIGGRAFENCVSLQTVHIPDSVTRIRYEAFAQCRKLRKIRLPESLTVLSGLSCSGLRHLEIPKSVEIIMSYALAKTELKEITIPATVKKIGDYAFDGCRNLKKVTFPKGIKELAGFSNTGLRHIYIPNSVVVIKACAFSGSRIERLTIPENVQEIGRSAFDRCRIRKLTIPGNVRKIDTDAFRACDELWDLHFSEGLVELSGFSYCRKLAEIHIPDSTEVIGENAFSFCESLKEVAIPGSVREISGEAFRNCRNLANVCFAEGLQEIRNGAFQGCGGLMRISLPKTLQTIGSEAFKDCAGLEEVVLPDGELKAIEQEAFSECTRLQDIRIPEGVIKIESRAFYKCRGLRKVVLPRSASEIAGDAFRTMNKAELVLYVEAGSEAEQYAIVNNYRYKIMEQ